MCSLSAKQRRFSALWSPGPAWFSGATDIGLLALGLGGCSVASETSWELVEELRGSSDLTVSQATLKQSFVEINMMNWEPVWGYILVSSWRDPHITILGQSRLAVDQLLALLW